MVRSSASTLLLMDSPSDSLHKSWMCLFANQISLEGKNYQELAVKSLRFVILSLWLLFNLSIYSVKSLYRIDSKHFILFASSWLEKLYSTVRAILAIKQLMALCTIDWLTWTQSSQLEHNQKHSILRIMDAPADLASPLVDRICSEILSFRLLQPEICSL